MLFRVKLASEMGVSSRMHRFRIRREIVGMRCVGFPLLIWIATAASAFTVVGCASDEGRHSHGRMRPNQPTLTDTAQFLDGTLKAELRLEPISFASDGGPGGSGDKGGGGKHRGRRGGFAGGGGSRSPDEMGSALPDDSGDGAPIPRPAMSALPSVELRAKFTNDSETPLVFAVTDVISGLGNFAVRPDRLSLAPHESGELEAMPATYPDVINELAVEIRVRHAGKNESRSLRLHGVASPAVAAP